MTTLAVGFDSAWTPLNCGAVAGVLRLDDGTYRELGPPRVADFPAAERIILQWQADHAPAATIVLLDQPTVVGNAAGQRLVENVVGSSVSLRYGGMQPANTGRADMFGAGAPLWPFLTRFGGPADPLAPVAGTRVFETYPVLAMIALGWTLPDPRAAGRLPKYNPQRRKTFSASDWRHVCALASAAFHARGLTGLALWVDAVALKGAPRKSDQDGLDACICLLAALHLAERKDCLMVGDLLTGYIVVPHSDGLCAELQCRCRDTGRPPSHWVRRFRMT